MADSYDDGEGFDTFVISFTTPLAGSEIAIVTDDATLYVRELVSSQIENGQLRIFSYDPVLEEYGLGDVGFVEYRP